MPFTIDPCRINRQGVLPPHQPAPRFDDKKTDAPLKRIDERAGERAEDGVSRATDDRMVQLTLAEGSEAVGIDKAKVGSRSIHAWE